MPTPFNNDLTVLSNVHTEEERQKAEQQLKRLGKVEVPSRSSYFGIVDLAGLKKDHFYIYQARWRLDFPMAHVLPHWNWPERAGEVTPAILSWSSARGGELWPREIVKTTGRTRFASPVRRAFKGLALVIVRNKSDESVAPTLKAESDGIDQGVATLKTASTPR